MCGTSFKADIYINVYLLFIYVYTHRESALKENFMYVAILFSTRVQDHSVGVEFPQIVFGN